MKRPPVKLTVARYDGRGGTVRVQPASKPPKMRFKIGEVVKHDGTDHVVLYAYRLKSDPHEWIYCVEEISTQEEASALRIIFDGLAKLMRLGEHTPRIVYELFNNWGDASTFFSDIPANGPSRSNVTNKTLLKQNPSRL
jgi:hypothetical protein